jgi:hypothetical protein
LYTVNFDRKRNQHVAASYSHRQAGVENKVLIFNHLKDIDKKTYP